MLKKKKSENQSSPQVMNLNKEEKDQIKKRRQKKDIVLDLNNKYKDYESEVVFKFYEKFKDDEEKKAKSKVEIEKKKEKKKKERAKVFSIKALKTEINGYGFSYSMKDYAITLLIMFAALFIAGIFYKLKIPYICILALVALLVMPQIIATQFQYIYEQQRFTDVVDYMEYMMYEFKKKPKILYALKAAEDSCTGNIKKRIRKAIEYIENGVYKEDLYKEAFYFIEEGYACERLGVLHQFLMKIEAEGGNYQSSLNIILDDVKSWTERTYEFQKEKAGIKTKVMITIILSLVMCAILTKTNESVISITDSKVYQCVTTGLIASLMILYTVVQKKLSGSWLMSDAIPRKRLFQQYAIAIAGDVKTMRKKNIPNVIIFVACGCLLYFGSGFIPALANFKNLGLVLWELAIFYFIKPSSDIKNAKKNTIKEINKEFPGWFRNLAINLQKETVQVSIKKSLKDAPLVLKPALISLIKELEDDPVTMKPYINFLSTFELPDIASAMKMLYSLNEAGHEEVVQQINTLVARNNALLEKSERLKNADSISMTGFLVVIPMGHALVKMIVDMGLILIGFMNNVHL